VEKREFGEKGGNANKEKLTQRGRRVAREL